MRKVRPSYFVLTVLFCAALAFLVYTLTGTRPPHGKRRRSARALKMSLPVQAGVSASQPAAPADADYGRYEMIATRNVFAPPAPPPSPVRKPTLLPPFNPPPPKPSGPVAPAPPAPPSFPGWSYLGFVEVDGKMIAILQNQSERSAEFVAAGDSFRGATVEQVAPTQVRLKGETGSVTLQRTETFSLVPLTKGAAPAPVGRAMRPLLPAPPAPGPGQPLPGQPQPWQAAQPG